MSDLEIRFDPRTIVHVSGGSFAGQKSKERVNLTRKVRSLNSELSPLRVSL